jgi:light-regulated signal transduction histidine kinase (bacteriophytochrome)
MQPLLAKDQDLTALQDLGRASLRIVHDLKNQLNGLKLYATFLRKRMERAERPQDERETIAKLIAGLDRAANDLTTLIRYAQPPELRRRPEVDLASLIAAGTAQNVKSLPGTNDVSRSIEAQTLVGEFDPEVLTEAFRALTLYAQVSSKTPPVVNARRTETNGVPEALIEWLGESGQGHDNPLRTFDGGSTSVGAAVATRIIESHGGRVNHDSDALRVWLPLTESTKERTTGD